MWRSPWTSTVHLTSILFLSDPLESSTGGFHYVAVELLPEPRHFRQCHHDGVEYPGEKNEIVKIIFSWIINGSGQDATSCALSRYNDVSLSLRLLSSHACTNHICANNDSGPTPASVYKSHYSVYDSSLEGESIRTPEVH